MGPVHGVGQGHRWLVAVGDELTEGAQVCEIDTDKIAGELESTWTGGPRIGRRRERECPGRRDHRRGRPAEVLQEDIDAGVGPGAMGPSGAAMPHMPNDLVRKKVNDFGDEWALGLGVGVHVGPVLLRELVLE